MGKPKFLRNWGKNLDRYRHDSINVDLDTHIRVLWRGCYGLKYIDTIGSVDSWKTRSQNFLIPAKLPTHRSEFGVDM